MRRFKEKYIGNRDFYSMIIRIALPIIIQNGITNLVGLLDNIMVGQLGTELMSGVAIANQLMFVFQISLFGLLGCSSIFGAQFYGQGNLEGFRSTFRFKILTSVVLMIVAALVFVFAGDFLIELFLTDNGVGDIALTHAAGMEYMTIMMVGLVPYAVTQLYASTLRETGETMLPMVAGVAAIFINLGLNYVLIFGHFGAPMLGVAGAAYATVIARFIEMFAVVIRTHLNSAKYVFIKGVYRTIKVPMEVVKQILWKGAPLFVNELLWSAGMTTLAQCYSVRGLNAVAAYNISSTVSNLFNVVFIAFGHTISIVVGQLLGSGKMEEAVDTNRKMIIFDIVICTGVGVVMFLLAPLFPQIYKTSGEVMGMATGILRIASVFMPFYAFYHAAYFTLRCGGKTWVTFLFDSCYLWVVNVVAAFIMSRFTQWPFVTIYLINACLESLKGIIGVILIKNGYWVNNIVDQIKLSGNPE